MTSFLDHLLDPEFQVAYALANHRMRNLLEDALRNSVARSGSMLDGSQHLGVALSTLGRLACAKDPSFREVIRRWLVAEGLVTIDERQPTHQFYAWAIRNGFPLRKHCPPQDNLTHRRFTEAAYTNAVRTAQSLEVLSPAWCRAVRETLRLELELGAS